MSNSSCAESEKMTTLREHIQSLPPELRAKILKEHTAQKLREKKAAGWGEVHEEILNAPYCKRRSIITNIVFCYKCGICLRNGLCAVCLNKKGEYHFLPFAVVEECPDLFKRAFSLVLKESQ